MGAKPTTILVTGAAGFIAYHCIESFLKQGARIIGIDNFYPFYDRSIKEKNISDLKAIKDGEFIFNEMDLNDLKIDSLRDFEFDGVIHLAANAGVRPSLEKPLIYCEANVRGTLSLLEFCKNRKIDKILFGSSSSVYGDSTPSPFKEDAVALQPISVYAANKRSCELHCYTYTHLYNLKIAALRFFTVYGPRQRPDLAIHKFCKLISQGQAIEMYGDGSTERDYTFVSDIVAGIQGAWKWAQKDQTSSFEIFNLGGSRTVSLKKLIELIEAEMGIKAEIKKMPIQAGDVKKTSADITKSNKCLGYSPQFPIEKGIAEFVKWFKSS